MRTHVDLFSGIGGFSLACQWAGVETIAFSEIDSYASRVLQRHWPNIRNYGDVRAFPGLSAWLLTAGVPCQPASVAGKRQGAADDRWLWPETLAVVENGSYEWLLFENPTGILSLNDGLEFERICAALESKGYEVQPLVIPACGVGALHRRNRVWIIAHARNCGFGQSLQPERFTECGEQANTRSDGKTRLVADASREFINVRGEGGEGWRAEPSDRGSNVAHADDARPQGRIGAELCERAGQQFVGQSDSPVADPACERLNGNRIAGQGWRAEFANGGGWAVEPDVGRVANGIPARVDRLRGLGNAIVPQVAYELIKRMIEAEDANA